MDFYWFLIGILGGVLLAGIIGAFIGMGGLPEFKTKEERHLNKLQKKDAKELKYRYTMLEIFKYENCRNNCKNHSKCLERPIWDKEKRVAFCPLDLDKGDNNG